MLNENDHRARISFGNLGMAHRRGLRRTMGVRKGNVAPPGLRGPACTKMRTRGAHFRAQLAKNARSPPS